MSWSPISRIPLGAMSVLDDIRSGAEAAHGAFDDARTLVRQAAEEADDLESSAAAHGWAGVAQAMASAKDALEAAAAAVESALESTSDAVRELGEITGTMSSDEVAERLGRIGSGFTDATGAADQALSSVDDATGAAAEADASSLAQALEEAGNKLKEARESLQQARSSTEQEQGEATTWGN